MAYLPKKMDKILKIQSEIGVMVKTETNPFFRSKYMDINGLLAQLMPLLEKYKLVVMQPIQVKDGKNILSTVIYDTEGDDPDNENSSFNGKWIEMDCDIMLPDLQDPQKMGSAITYYRRYALQSLFLLRAEDDDANTASSKKSKINNKEDEELGF